MTLQLTTDQQESRKKHMIYFIETSYYFVGKDVMELTPEEAKDKWSVLKGIFRDVCLRSGMGNRQSRDKWTSVMRKMILLRDKANGDKK